MGWPAARLAALAVLAGLATLLAACGGGGGGDGDNGGGDVGGGTGPVLTAEYVPLATGDLRTYRRQGASEFEPLEFERVGRSLTVEGRAVFELVDGDGAIEYLGLTASALVSVPGAGSDALARALGPLELLRLGVRAGNEYTALDRSISADVDGDGTIDTLQVRVRVRFVGFESVSAGGTNWADAARLRTQVDLTAAGGGATTLVIEDWYGRGIGRVRSRIQDNTAASGSVEEQELIGWRVGSQRSDSVAPQLVSVTPALGVQTRAPAWLTLVFSEPLHGVGLDGEQGLRLRAADGSAVAASLVRLFGSTYELRPDATLPDGRYTLVAGDAVSDLAGNPLVLSGLPALELDTTAPFVAASMPRQGDTDAPLEGELSITFSEPVTLLSATPRIVIGQPFGGGFISLDATFDGTTLRATLPAPLQRDREYQMSWEGNIVDAAGIFRSPQLLSFRTTSGPLQRAASWVPGYTVNALVRGDVDGDGRDDLIFTGRPSGRFDGVVGLRLASPGGGLGPLQLLLTREFSDCSGPVKLGDFDGDGRNDVLVGGCDLALGRAVLLRQTAAGVFAAEDDAPRISDSSQGPLRRPGEPRALLVIEADEPEQLRVMVRHGPGDWREVQRLADAGPIHATALADLNGDGHADLAWLSQRLDVDGATPLPPRLGLAFGSATGFGAPGSLALDIPPNGDIRYTARRLHPADPDGDGRIDIVIGTEASLGLPERDRIAWLRNDGAGGFEAPRLLQATEGTAGLASGDLNGDGLVDLVVSVDQSSVAVFLGTAGDGLQPERVFRSEFVASVRPTVAAVIDVDGDGRADLVYGESVLRSTTPDEVWPQRSLLRRVVGR